MSEPTDAEWAKARGFFRSLPERASWSEQLAKLLAAHRDTERDRVLRVLDEVIQAAEDRHKGHHATPWLYSVRNAVESGALAAEIAEPP